MWPDLAKFRHFWLIVPVFGHFLRVYLVILIIQYSLTWRWLTLIRMWAATDIHLNVYALSSFTSFTEERHTDVDRKTKPVWPDVGKSSPISLQELLKKYPKQFLLQRDDFLKQPKQSQNIWATFVRASFENSPIWPYWICLYLPLKWAKPGIFFHMTNIAQIWLHR